MAFLSLPALLFVLIFVCSLAYLSWQANIEIPEKEELFKVETYDSVTATRNPDESVLFLSSKDISNCSIKILDRSDHLQSIQGKTTQQSKHALTLKNISLIPRPYFLLESPEHPPVVVAERILSTIGINNFRDLGGYHARDNRMMKWGLLFRSGHLGTPDEIDKQIIKDLGIRTIVDLRSPQERRKMPDAQFEGVNNLHIPLFRSDPVMYGHIMFQRHKLGQRLEDIYTTWVIDGSAKELGRIFALISEPENLPLLFHCTAGKDRTGITAALLLLAIGISESTVIADYTLSNAAADRFMADYEQPLSIVRFLGIKQEHFYPIIATPPEMMVFTIDHIKRKYGSILNYLTSTAGVSMETIERLKRILLSETQ